MKVRMRPVSDSSEHDGIPHGWRWLAAYSPGTALEIAMIAGGPDELSRLTPHDALSFVRSTGFGGDLDHYFTWRNEWIEILSERKGFCMQGGVQSSLCSVVANDRALGIWWRVLSGDAPAGSRAPVLCWDAGRAGKGCAHRDVTAVSRREAELRDDFSRMNGMSPDYAERFFHQGRSIVVEIAALARLAQDDDDDLVCAARQSYEALRPPMSMRYLEELRGEILKKGCRLIDDRRDLIARHPPDAATLYYEIDMMHEARALADGKYHQSYPLMSESDRSQVREIVNPILRALIGDAVDRGRYGEYVDILLAIADGDRLARETRLLEEFAESDPRMNQAIEIIDRHLGDLVENAYRLDDERSRRRGDKNGHGGEGQGGHPFGGGDFSPAGPAHGGGLGAAGIAGDARHAAGYPSPWLNHPWIVCPLALGIAQPQHPRLSC